MPKTRTTMPEMFHMTINAFRRGTKPVKGNLFGFCNRPLIASSTGSGVLTWITNRAKPITMSQAQRGSRFRHPLGVLEVYPPVCFPNGIRIL